MPRILPFKDPEPEEINGFKDITEAVNFLDDVGVKSFSIVP